MAEMQYYGTGRRKSATARVYLRPGGGNFKVNGAAIDKYFKNEALRMIIRQPLQLTDTVNKFDVVVNVDGGGVRARPARCVTASRARCSNSTPSCARSSRRPDCSHATRAPKSARSTVKRARVSGSSSRNVNFSCWWLVAGGWVGMSVPPTTNHQPLTTNN